MGGANSFNGWAVTCVGGAISLYSSTLAIDQLPSIDEMRGVGDPVNPAHVLLEPIVLVDKAKAS
jgi:hypothetical protein